MHMRGIKHNAYDYAEVDDDDDDDDDKGQFIG